MEDLTLSQYYSQQNKGLANALILSKHLELPVTIIDALLNKYSVRYSQSRKYNQQPVKRIRYNAAAPGDVLHLDVMFLSNKKKLIDRSNKHLTPIVVVVDTYSRYVWLFRQKTKAMDVGNIQSVIDEIHKHHGEKEVVIITDDGGEMTHLTKIKHVKWIVSKSNFGASIAEGTIARIRNLFSRLDNIAWLKVNEIAENLNNVNIPSVAKKADATPFELFTKVKTRKQYKSRALKGQQLLDIGDRVRVIQNDNLALGQKYSQTPFFSKTIYKVIARQAYNGIYKYTLDNDKARKYYIQELQKID